MNLNNCKHRSSTVIVAHPGTQHSYQTALGLQEAGMLKEYITGFYYKKSGSISSLLHVLPAKFSARLERELNRRRRGELDDNLIRTVPIPELAYVSFARLRFLQRWSVNIFHLRNEMFDRSVARIVQMQRPEAVICYNGSALNTFKMAKEIGVVCILDQTLGHLREGFEIAQEEAVLHPEFADSIVYDGMAQIMDRCNSEALDADRILAGSEYVRDSLVANGVLPSRVAILHYGADTERFYPVSKSDHRKFRILFVGGISQRKGIKYLLEAFRRLRLQNAELILVGGIVGNGNGLRPYQDIFKHVPNVPHNEVHVWFQSADVFVYPSLYEGSAIAIYEALACGIPVITTRNAGSVVRDGEEGFIVPIRDVETLMEKILVLYQDRELRETMGQKARKRAENFTWKNYRRRLCDLVEDFVQKKTP
jgi:starch synthase